MDQIKQSSLARIICDNGDDMNSITPNPFLNMESDSGNVLIGCNDIPSVGLEMWSGMNDCKDFVTMYIEYYYLDYSD